MPITVVEPNHSGNLATAFGLWDQFLGPTSKIRKAQLAEAQQGLQNAQQTHDITGELRQPNLDTAKALSAVHQNEAAKSITDEATRKGAISAFNQAPVDMLVPTTEMNPDQLSQWRDLHAKNGVNDLSGAAVAWNKATSNVLGRQPVPQGGIPQTYQTANGETTVGGMVYDPSRLPDLGNIFGGSPAAPATAPGAPGAPASQPARPSAAAAPGPTPGAPAALPDLGQLARLAANPFARAVAENAIKMRNDLATANEKEQAIEKGSRDVAFGPPEERQKEGDFIRNAAQMSHRLEELETMVRKNGNYAFPWEAEHDAKLRSLPMDIADNWNAIAGKQGVIREGTVQMAMEHQIPIAQHIWNKASTWNATTEAAVAQTKKVLADYVRQHENLPTTKMPVEGLTPAVRAMVGKTKFGEPKDLPSEQGAAAASGPVVTSLMDAVNSVPVGRSYQLFNPQTGKSVKFTRGNEPWAKPAAPAGLPPINPSSIGVQPPAR